MTTPSENAMLGATEPPAPATPRVIRVLVVDDSAFVRKVVREMLGRSPLLEVIATARDGDEALRLAEELKPDVITCDLMMPGIDGVEFVRRQLARNPLPILILSASPEDADRVLAALEAGAVDFVRKPTALATDELLGIRGELIEKVKAAARAPVGLPRGTSHPIPQSPLSRTGRGTQVELVVLGISTGGPQALRHLLPQLPADLAVPLAIVLHMPVGYTAAFAEKLNELSQVTVVEAREGEPFLPGCVMLAQAGRHLAVRRNAAGRLVAHLPIQPLDRVHRPSVDVLFQSAAETVGSHVLGVVMTGMGDDGKQGAAWIKAQGGIVITEAKESCVIYGMPRSVEEAGLSDASVPLHRLAEAILQRL